MLLLLELERRQVVQAAVRSYCLEVKPPSLDDDLRLGARAEPLDAQALIAVLRRPCPYDLPATLWNAPAGFTAFTVSA